METIQTDNNNNNIPEKKKGNRFLRFIWRHKLVVFLLLAVIGIFTWAQVKLYYLEDNFTAQKIEITNKYEVKLDSMSIAGMGLTAKAFSWAIRSELLRENNEQVNQYFLSFIKEPDIIKLQLVDPATSVIFIATDKKDEGQTVTDTRILQANSTYTSQDSVHFTIATPIMGLNNKLAILIIEARK